MKQDINNIVFSTKNIMATEKQKEFISVLQDDLLDINDLDFNYLEDKEIEKLSKQQASIVINQLKELYDDYFSDIGRFYDMLDTY